MFSARYLFVVVICTFMSMYHASGNSVSVPSDVAAESYRSFRITVSYGQFVELSSQEQSEILTDMLRKANRAYQAAETIEEMYDLRADVEMIDLYIRSGKRPFLTQQKDYNILYNKINRTIREYEGGITVYEEASGYTDSGQK